MLNIREYLIPYQQGSQLTYAEQILEKINIDLNGEEEYLAKKTLLPEVEQALIGEMICPDCGTHLVEYPEATSPHDFEMQLGCGGCGTLITTH